ncbi:MAG: orotidine-5'-phosphate decarboxylase [Deltaproteobacteria bacterium]|nr:MAG: orotidine-5'-phosphate decarboxylase [Deltaproteobacteria bacterium]
MKEPKDYIIFPLDLPSYDKAMPYVEVLKDDVGLFKVGLELFISEGPHILRSIREEGGAGIFLDLKLHDIPVTMSRAFMAASRHGPQFVSVHCDQGEDMLRNVAENNPGKTKILGITLLTSLNRDNLLRLGYKDVYVEDPGAMVLLRARMAMEAGCHGVVCSGLEVARIRRELGEHLIVVTPGIRPAWSVVSQDDQKRIVTPKAAVQNGADFVVIGRPIRDAQDPAVAAKRVAEEIASAL